jgi:hypothetical protein
MLTVKRLFLIIKIETIFSTFRLGIDNKEGQKMKKTVSLVLLVSLALGISFLPGCEDEKLDGGGVQPGDLNDSTYLLFKDHFGWINGQNGVMFVTMFIFLDEILHNTSVQQPSLKPSDTLTGITITYHDANQYWYCSAFYETPGATVYLIDSIQFSQDAAPVKIPDTTRPYSIKSYMRGSLTGQDINSGDGYQNLTMSFNNAGSSLLTVNGGGAVSTDASLYYNYPDSSRCDFTFDFSVSANNLIIDMEQLYPSDTSVIPATIVVCPQGGSITYRGTIDSQCSGDRTDSLSGSWTVTQAYQNGAIITTTSNNYFVWTEKDTCQ